MPNVMEGLEARLEKLSMKERITLVTGILEERISSGDKKVFTLAELQEQYPTISTKSLNTWIRRTYGMGAEEYLRRNHLLLTSRDKYLATIKKINKLDLKGKAVGSEFYDEELHEILRSLKISYVSGDSLKYASIFVVEPEKPLANEEEYSEIISHMKDIRIITKDNMMRLLGESKANKEKGASFVTDTEEEKLSRAIEVYRKCVSEIENKMKTHDNYNPIVASESYIKGAKKESEVSYEKANDFFEKALAILKEEGAGVDAGIMPIKLKKWWKELYRTLITRYKYLFDGEVGVRYPVGVAVAYLIYANPKAEIKIVFDHDKWENRGDYKSAERVCIEMTDYGESIEVYEI